MHSDLLKGLNEHLRLEFRAAHEYLAMSIWLSANDLPGFSTWMRRQSSDELTHAQRIIDHLLERDQQPVLPAIPAPPKSWKSLEALCLHVLKNEQEVTASINELYAVAEKSKDFKTRPWTLEVGGLVNKPKTYAIGRNQGVRLGRLTMTDNSKSTGEKVLVCVGPGPSSAGLINSAKSMAAGLHAKWFAVYVEDPKAVMLPAADRNRATDNLRLAEQSGAETFTLSGRNIAEEIIKYAMERNISRIIAGKLRRSLWKSILSGGPVDRLVRMSGEIDVNVMAGELGAQGGTIYVMRPKSAHLADYGTGFLFLILATVLCFLMYPYFQLDMWSNCRSQPDNW